MFYIRDPEVVAEGENVDVLLEFSFGEIIFTNFSHPEFLFFLFFIVAPHVWK